MMYIYFCLLLTSDSGNLREKLRLSISHPGNDTGFHRGGSGASDHPEEQPSTGGARQSPGHHTGGAWAAAYMNTIKVSWSLASHVSLPVSNLWFSTQQGVGRCIPQLAWPDGRGLRVWRPAKERAGVSCGSSWQSLTSSRPKKGAGGVGFMSFCC